MRSRLTSPRLWGEVWRLGLALLLGLVLWASLSFAFVTFPDAEWKNVLRVWVDPVLGLVGVALLHWRRRWPLGVALTTAALTSAAVMPVGAAGIALVSLATHRQWRRTLLGGAAFLAAGVVFMLFFDPTENGANWISNVITSVLAVAAAIGMGSYIGARRDNIATLQEQVAAVEREQASRVEQARATERARIAREMHDVLAHRISLIAMHAGALAYRQDLPREQVHEIATLLRDNADEAVTELRTVLGVLRGADEPDQPLAPQPDLHRLPELVGEATRAGSTVRLTCGVDPHEVPETISRNAYRIMQEGLTNARKHAPGMPITVTVTGARHQGLDVTVLNPPAPYGVTSEAAGGSGMGLLGLTERATLSGGRFSYGTDRAGRFVVHAWLPWEADGHG